MDLLTSSLNIWGIIAGHATAALPVKSSASRLEIRFVPDLLKGDDLYIYGYGKETGATVRAPLNIDPLYIVMREKELIDYIETKMQEVMPSIEVQLRIHSEPLK